MPSDWNIKPRSAACSACSTSFEDGARYFSELTAERDGCERTDFCETCWSNSREASERRFSSWQGLFRSPPVAEKRAPVKKETVESLLRRLIDSDGASNAEVVYILAIMLERGKVLIERDSNRNEYGEKRRIYEHRRTGEVFVILDPELQFDRLDEVNRRIAELLGQT